MYFIVKIPLLSWRQVIQELDYPEFNVPSREGLQLLFTACHRGLMEIFPVDVLYRSWTNTEGQVLFCLLFVTFSTVPLSFPVPVIEFIILLKCPLPFFSYPPKNSGNSFPSVKSNLILPVA